MNTNYEAITSLVGLLVKKAGFDVEKNYIAEEYDKTRELISKYSSNNYFLNDLKKRKTSLENNAEVVGKYLLDAYKEGKTYEEVKQKIEDLANLASEDKESIKGYSLMSYVYNTVIDLENEYEEITKKLDDNDYFDSNSKESDTKMQTYLEHKINEINEERSFVRNEIERLENVIQKDEDVLHKLLDQEEIIKNNIKKLNKAKEDIDEKTISVEVWEKLKNTEIKLDERNKYFTEEIKKQELMMTKNNESITEYKKRKEELDKDYSQSTNSYEYVTKKLNENDYIDYTNITIDENKKENIKNMLEKLKNKKEVIYIDVPQVKNELINEWKKRVPYVEEKVKESKEKKIEQQIVINEPKIEEQVIDETEEVDIPELLQEEKKIKPEKKEEKSNNKIELDW